MASTKTNKQIKTVTSLVEILKCLKKWLKFLKLGTLQGTLIVLSAK